MKSILISIKPYWVAKILNGEKTIEVRRTAPKCELPIEVYIYCTKNKLHYRVGALIFNRDDCFKHSVDGTYKYGDSVELMGYSPDYPYDKNNFLNGKVVAKFTLREVTKYINGCNVYKDSGYMFGDAEREGVYKKACLSESELDRYCPDESFYAWHIEDLQIFDEPKEISEFKYEKKKVRLTEKYHWKTERLGLVQVKKAPQSWQYVEEKA